jgi:methylamine dehydrogenase accessory protein MauD
MSFLIASQIALWIAVILLGALCLALARQVGVLHERIAPAGALMLAQQTVRVGRPAPRLELASLTGAAVTIGGERGGRSQLLFFLAPDCPICKSLLPALRTCAQAERGWLDVVLASDGSGEDHASFVRAHHLENFDYVVSEALGRGFGVAKLPYATLIDEQGRIASMGLINSREHLESLFEAKERGVATLQEFLIERSAAGRPRETMP